MKTGSIVLLILFVLCSAADLIAVGKGNARAERIAKPLLMPLLLAFYLLSAKVPNPLIALALVCGFLGDTFLLGSGVFFLCGLFVFLLGHVFYITAFLKPPVFAAMTPLFWVSAILLYVLYAVPVCRRLLPSVGPKLRPAAILYMVFLLTMSCSSLLRYPCTDGTRFWLPFIGSLFFVASDTMLAFRAFRKDSCKVPETAVMTTYLAAQALIVLGFLT